MNPAPADRYSVQISRLENVITLASSAKEKATDEKVIKMIGIAIISLESAVTRIKIVKIDSELKQARLL